MKQGGSQTTSLSCFCDHTCAIIVILDLKIHESMWIQWPFFQKLEPKVIDPKMTVDPKSVEVTCVTIPKDHCVQVPPKIYQSMCGYSDPFSKTWSKGHWPLDDLWPHVCWRHMCDSTQGSLCPSPMGIHQCWYSDQFCRIPHTYYIHTDGTYDTTYRMSDHNDHIVSYWTQFRRDKKLLYSIQALYTFHSTTGQFCRECCNSRWL